MCSRRIQLLFAAAVLALCAMTAIASSAQTYRTLHAFDLSDGEYPNSALVQASDGNLYGTAQSGGVRLYDGTLFKITPDGIFTLLASFVYPGPASPTPSLIQASDGMLWGTTFGGGPEALGTVFKANLTGTITTVHLFQGGSEGANPYAGVIQASDGNFYGTTIHDGSGNDGTVYQLTPDGVLTTLHAFSGIDGSQPFSTLLQDAQGNFYGTTSAGGAIGYGTIFKISATGAFTDLHDFNSTDGADPLSGLIRGADGNFYGTASEGGAEGLGTVYRISSTGSFMVLHSFQGAEGSDPVAALTPGMDGNFYGTTVTGGTNNNYGCGGGCGTAFKMTPTGTLTTLISFGPRPGPATGCRFPEAGLVQATNGRFYGAALGGGNGHGMCYAGCGTLFAITVSADGTDASASQSEILH